MARKKLPKGVLKKAWAEAKKKNIPKKNRARWAMKRAWQLAGHKKSSSRNTQKSTKSTSRSSAKGKSTASKPGGVSRMGNRGFNTQKLFKLVRVGSLLMPIAEAALNPALSPRDKVSVIGRRLTGYDMNTGQFNFEWLKEGYLPFLVTTAVTAMIPKVSSFVRGIMK